MEAITDTDLGFRGDPHLNPIHLLSNIVIFAGFILLSSAWPALLKARHEGTLATRGPYGHVRHPRYVVMFGFLLPWPALVTLVMFPILVVT